MNTFQRTISVGLSMSFVLGLWATPVISPTAHAYDLNNSVLVQDDQADEDLSPAEMRREERRKERELRREEIRERREKLREERQEKLRKRREDRLKIIEERRLERLQEIELDQRQPDDVDPIYSPYGEHLRYIPLPGSPTEGDEMNADEPTTDEGYEYDTSRRLRRR